ncbi:MAG: CerR family C-terminal domain-containing protein [Victivallaceae bacterium]
MTTKEKIIDAAIQEFSDVGYSKATIRNICQHAGVNVAAINYHFSNKCELYRHAFDSVCIEDHSISLPSGENISSQTELEEFLHEWIRVFMTRMFEREKLEDQRKIRMVMNELLNPSEISDELFNKYLRKDVAPLIKIVSAGLPPDAEQNDILIKVFAILGKCIFYFFHRRVTANLSGITDFGRKNFEKIVIEILRESLVGLNYQK